MNNSFYLSLMMGPMVAVPVPGHLIDALSKIQVTANTDQRSGFQLTFTVAKNSRILNELMPVGFFDAPVRVIVAVTLKGQTTVLIDGVITQHDYAPSNEPGQSTLTVTGVDFSQMMDMIDFSGIPWPAMPAEARVAIILARYLIFGVIPIIIPTPLLFVPNPLEGIPGQQGTDYQYVRHLADRVGYVFYVAPGPKPGMNFAYWGPENKFGEAQPALTVNSDASSNVESLSFSFNGLGKTILIVFVQNKETKVPIPVPLPDIGPLNPPLGKKPPFPLTSTFLNRYDEKENMANKQIIEAVMSGLGRAAQSADVITASGSLDVMRYGHVLKPRSLVGVRGAGPSYDGHYYVKSVTHNIKRGEYKQSFTLTRNATISLTSSVKV